MEICCSTGAIASEVRFSKNGSAVCTQGAHDDGRPRQGGEHGQHAVVPSLLDQLQALHVFPCLLRIYLILILLTAGIMLLFNTD